MEGYQEVVNQMGMGAGFFVLALLLLRWAVKHWERMSEDSATERRAWLDEIAKMHKEKIRADERIESQALKVNEAHGFQREEHQKMIANLSEITFSLRSINGGSSARK